MRKKIEKTTAKPAKRFSNAEKYAQKVINGDIIANKWVKKACERYFYDLDHQEQLGIYLDKKAGSRALRFFKCLKHSKGEWAGTEFKLEPWQEFIVWNLFGWKRTVDDYRRFRTAYLEVARKNGKTTLVAGIGLYLFVADGEPGAEIYSAATKKDQASISHSEATRMVSYSPLLKSKIGTFRNNLNCESTHSKFEPLGADADTADGLNIHGAIVDELHAHKTRDLLDRLVTATAARRQPLIIAITTAGYDRESVCWEQHAYAEKILERTATDESFFSMIYCLDEGDDWQDETKWIKANPNLGISVKADDLRRKAKRAKEIPAEVNTFLRMHMDIWTESITRWISVEKWDLCGEPVIESQLTGRSCGSGLDLSSTGDITALVHVFPPVYDDEKYKIIARFFIPEENMIQRVRRDRVPYDVWVRQGYVQATPGNVVDYAFILHQLDLDAQKFDLRDLCFDRWGATKIVQDLQEMGFEKPSERYESERHLIDFGQGFASMSSPTKELEKMIIGQQISHGGNPVLRWMASNCVIRSDPAGNIKIDKSKSTERVDGIVALVMAISRATILKEQPEVGIYGLGGKG